MSFESQTAVCAFNCAQTPSFSGLVGRSRNDKASLGDRCSDGPVPVWFCVSFPSDRAALQVPPKKYIYRKNFIGKHITVWPYKCTSQTAQEFDFLLEFQQRAITTEPLQAPHYHNHTPESHLSCLTVARGVIRLSGPLGKCRPLSKSTVWLAVFVSGKMLYSKLKAPVRYCSCTLQTTCKIPYYCVSRQSSCCDFTKGTSMSLSLFIDQFSFLAVV